MIEEEKGRSVEALSEVPEQLDLPGFEDPGWNPYMELPPEPLVWRDYLLHPGSWILLLLLLLLLALGVLLFVDQSPGTLEEVELAELLSYERVTRTRPAVPSPVTQPNGVEEREVAFDITTVPPGAAVLLDDVEIGVSPIRQYRAQTGWSFLTIRKEGYTPQDTLVHLTEGDEASSFFFVLDPPDSAGDRFWGAPADPEPGRHQAAGASARANAPPRDDTPRVEKGRQGSGQDAGVREKPADAGVREKPADAAPAASRPVVEAATGSVTVLVRPWGSIYIDDTLHRRDSDVQYTTVLPVGEYRIRVVHPTLGTREQVVHISASQTQQIVVDLMSGAGGRLADAAKTPASSGGSSQRRNPDENGIYLVAEEMPKLAGHVENLSKQARYPERALRFRVQGKVYVQFVVDEQGRVHTPRVVKGLGHGCDEEAVRIISQARFEPGRVAGRPVKAWHTIFVTFSLPK